MSVSLNYPCSQETSTQDSAIISSESTSVVGESTVSAEISTAHTNIEDNSTTPSNSKTSVAQESTINKEKTTTYNNTEDSVTTPNFTTSVSEASRISEEITTTLAMVEISTENSHANVCCVCKNVTTTALTKQEVEESLSRIRLELLLKVKFLNSYRRKKTSTGDKRASSIAMGTVAVIVLVTVCTLIVIVDLSNITSCFRSCAKVNNHT